MVRAPNWKPDRGAKVLPGQKQERRSVRVCEKEVEEEEEGTGKEREPGIAATALKSLWRSGKTRSNGASLGTSEQLLVTVDDSSSEQARS